MDDLPRTLAEVLEPIYGYYLRSLCDEGLARKWMRDAPVISAGIGVALHRVDSPVWWAVREPSGPADDTPNVIAMIDGTDLLRFDVATQEDVKSLPNAGDLAPDGRPFV